VKEPVVTYLCVALIFFVTGRTFPTRTLVPNYSHWKPYLSFCPNPGPLFSRLPLYTWPLASARPTQDHGRRTLGHIDFYGQRFYYHLVPISSDQAGVETLAMAIVHPALGNFIGLFIPPLLRLIYLSTGA